jgi:hypothetical protein
MKLRRLAILLTIPLWACASKPDSSAGSGSAPPGPSAQPASSESSGGPSALSIIATPFYIVFKIPVCLGAAPLLGPGAIASAIVPFKDNAKDSGDQLVAKDVTEACGPPWVANAH